MYLKQKDIFWAMSTDFVKKIMNISVTESHETGELLFREGDPACQFYILLKGRVKLSLGETSHVVHIVSNAGEAFGWSSLIDRDVFSTTAECMMQTKLIRLEKEALQKVLEQNPAEGLVFFKRLAGILGSRLLQSYRMIPSVSHSEATQSFGTGQMMAATTGN